MGAVALAPASPDAHFSLGKAWHERNELARAVACYENVEVDGFDGLLVEFAAQRGANLILRGIRAISDYELELQMALMNRRLKPEVETAFLMAREEYSFVSSHLVKEVAALGGDVSSMVPPAVDARLKERFAAKLAAHK